MICIVLKLCTVYVVCPVSITLFFLVPLLPLTQSLDMIDDEVSYHSAVFEALCGIVSACFSLLMNDLKIKQYKNTCLCSGRFPCVK